MIEHGALDRTLEINQKHLELAFRNGKRELDYLVLGTVLLGLTVIIAANVGLMPRLDEYAH